MSQTLFSNVLFLKFYQLKKKFQTFRIFSYISIYIDLVKLKIIIPDTRRIKRYTRFVGKYVKGRRKRFRPQRFVGKYVTGRRKRFRPHEVCIFLIRIASRVDLAMSVCPSVRMNAEVSETIREWDLACRFLSFLRSASLLHQCATPTLTPTNRPQTSKNRKYERGYWL